MKTSGKECMRRIALKLVNTERFIGIKLCVGILIRFLRRRSKTARVMPTVKYIHHLSKYFLHYQCYVMRKCFYL
jgi:hypothetical protein